MKKVLIMVLAGAVLIAGIIAATYMTNKNKDNQSNAQPTKQASLPTADDQEQSAKPTQKQQGPRLGNNDDAIGYTGDGTIREDVIKTGKDGSYSGLGNGEAAAGLQPIEEFNTIEGYATKMFGEDRPGSISLEFTGTVGGSQASGMASFAGQDSHLKWTSADGTVTEAYAINKNVYHKDGKDWKETGKTSVTADSFVKDFISVLESKNITGFSHYIDTTETSDAPVEGETVLNFKLKMDRADALMTSLNNILTDSDAAAGITGELAVTARLDRWGQVEFITFSGNGMSIGETALGDINYTISFTGFDDIDRIYLPGTEPTPTPTPEPPTPVPDEGGTGSEPADSTSQKGIKKDPAIKGRTISSNTPKKTSRTGEKYMPDVTLDEDTNSFEMIEGVVMTFAGYDDVLGLRASFSVLNKNDVNYSLEVADVCYNADMGGASPVKVDVPARGTSTITVSWPDIASSSRYTDPSRLGFYFIIKNTDMKDADGYERYVNVIIGKKEDDDPSTYVSLKAGIHKMYARVDYNSFSLTVYVPDESDNGGKSVRLPMTVYNPTDTIYTIEPNNVTTHGKSYGQTSFGISEPRFLFPNTIRTFSAEITDPDVVKTPELVTAKDSKTSVTISVYDIHNDKYLWRSSAGPTFADNSSPAPTDKVDR